MAQDAFFWIGVGDVHQDLTGFDSIPRLSEARGLILSGDLTNHGGAREAATVLAAARRRNPTVLAQLGNMDTAAVDSFLAREGVNLHRTVRQLDPAFPDLGVLGVGASTFTPFGTPSEVSEDQYGRWLEEAHAAAARFAHLLVVIHNPPHGGGADRVAGGVHVGSPAVRAFLERIQPDVCLTGHIHESVCEERLGRTLVINPGPLAAGGHAVIALTPQGFTARLEGCRPR